MYFYLWYLSDKLLVTIPTRILLDI